MALERKDVRFKLDAETHAQLKAICEFDDVDLGVFIESLLVPVVVKRVHDCIGLADRLHRLGIAGSDSQNQGMTGSAGK